MTDLQAQASIGSRLRADADLAFEFDEQYRARLCHLVEREMDRRFRPKEDPEDVVQSAFRTFFRRNAQGEFHIDSSVDLWRLLETITRRKILKHVEKLGAGKRSPKREEYAEGDDLQGSAPTPEEAAIAADLMEKSLAGLDESYVQVLHLRLQNCTEEEIAARLGCTRGHVRTRLQHIRQRLQKLSDDEEKPADLCAVLQYCLMSPASEYLTGLGQSADVAADPPPRRDPMDMTLGELFQRTDPPLGLLGAVMRRARRLMSPEASDSMLVARVSPPIEVHQILYFASIAAALVRHGERISKSSPDELRAAWKRLAAGPFADARLQRLFALAGELPNPGPSARLS